MVCINHIEHIQGDPNEFEIITLYGRYLMKMSSQIPSFESGQKKGFPARIKKSCGISKAEQKRNSLQV